MGHIVGQTIIFVNLLPKYFSISRRKGALGEKGDFENLFQIRRATWTSPLINTVKLKLSKVASQSDFTAHCCYPFRYHAFAYIPFRSRIQ